MNSKRPHNRDNKNPEVRIIRKKMRPSPEEEAKRPVIDSHEISEKEERDREFMRLIKETEDFDPTNTAISSFIHGPEHVQIVSTLNNIDQGIPLDEPRPCSYTVRQERYKKILDNYSRRNTVQRSATNNYANLRSLLSYLIFLNRLQNREITPEDYDLLLSLDRGITFQSRQYNKIKKKIKEKKFDV